MILYVINGNAYTWDYVHNHLGYSEDPSMEMQYKSAYPQTWGELVPEMYGYWQYMYFEDPGSGTFFATGYVGWVELNDLATEVGLYPANFDDGPMMTDGNSVSPSAVYSFNGDLSYLIRDAVNLGWIPENMLSDYGWEIVDDTPYEFVLVDASTGRVTSGVEKLNEMVFAPTGYLLIEDVSEIVFVEESPFPVVCIDEGTRTPENIAPYESFDTGLPYYASKLYIITTDDGQDETLYGWQAIQKEPYYALCGVLDSTSKQDIVVHVSYEMFGVLAQDS